MSSTEDRRPRIALLLHSLPLGGAERTMLALASGLAKKSCNVDLLLIRRRGALLNEVPPAINVIEIGASSRVTLFAWLSKLPWHTLRLVVPVLLRNKQPSVVRSLPNLIRYLQSASPHALLTTLPNYNIVALWAKWLCRSRATIVICEANTTSKELVNNSQPFESRWPALMHQWYPSAAAIVAVSDGVAADLAGLANIPRKRIRTIFNGVDLDRVRQLASSPITDPWFASGAPPVLLAVGRLAPQKDYRTLLKAFARVRERREIRLIVLGEGPERRRLENMVSHLGIASDVKILGEMPNPFPFMARARLFVLSSAWEGLPTVLLEALACGCPVVSTDCPSGPSEILEGGALGRLAAVGDDVGLAHAIVASLNESPDYDRLRKAASRFSLDRTLERYLEILIGKQCRSACAPLGFVAAQANRQTPPRPGPSRQAQ